MYELIILGFLIRSPMNGYRISKIIGDIVGPYTKFSSGRLYPLLGKLEKQAFIRLISTHQGGRQRMYEITDLGKEHFYHLIMDTTSNLGEYQKLFWYKAIFFDLLTRKQRIYLLDHYITYCQTHIFYIQREMEDLKQRFQDESSQLQSVVTVMNRNINIWISDFEYVQSLRKQEDFVKGE